MFSPDFSRHFFQNFALGLCGVSKVINIGSGNTILNCDQSKTKVREKYFSCIFGSFFQKLLHYRSMWGV